MFYGLFTADGVFGRGGIFRSDPSGHVSLVHAFTGQEGWKWCKKCEGLFFAEGEGSGVCPAGKEHDASESGRYVMLIGADGGQTGWRRCKKCEGLFFGGEKRRGSCPAGKEHDPDDVEYVSCMASSEIPPGK